MTKEIKGDGIFERYLIFSGILSHKNNITSEGIETQIALILKFSNEYLQFINTSCIFFSAFNPKKELICVMITIAPIPHMNPAITGYGV